MNLQKVINNIVLNQGLPISSNIQPIFHVNASLRRNGSSRVARVKDGANAARRVHDGRHSDERFHGAINVHLAGSARSLGTGYHRFLHFPVVNQSFENHFNIFNAELHLRGSQGSEETRATFFHEFSSDILTFPMPFPLISTVKP